MSRGRAARAANAELSAEIMESDLVKPVEDLEYSSAADEALLEAILKGHETRTPTKSPISYP